jgi:hypothetical protein
MIDRDQRGVKRGTGGRGSEAIYRCISECVDIDIGRVKQLLGRY